MPAKHCAECEIDYPHEDEYDRCPVCEKYTRNYLGREPDDEWMYHLARELGRPVPLDPLKQTEVAEWNGQWYLHNRVLKMHGYAAEEGTIVRILARSERGPDIFVEIMGRAGTVNGVKLPGWWVKRVDPAEEFADLPVLAGGD